MLKSSPSVPSAGVVLLSVVSVFCTSTPCGPPSQQPPAQVQVVYSSGGPAPLISQLTLSASGCAEFVSDRGIRRSRRVDPRDAAAVFSLLDSASVREVLIQIKKKRYDLSLADWEMVELIFRGNRVVVPMDRVPGPVGDVLARLDSLFSKAFGSFYSVRLVE